MASETSLNQLVKGAPPPDAKVPPVAPLPPLAQSSNETLNALTSKSKTRTSSSLSTQAPSTTHVTDTALSSLPSSPPQIYLNLLILEASLRSQYLHLLSRRRLNTFFLLVLLLWNVFFTWALFFRPREDGTGHGGSVYWVVETGEKVLFMAGIVTVLLVKATGQWERGIRWPRRWLGTTNRGLRGFNLRVVVTRGRWWRDMLSHFAFLLPFGLWREAGGSDWHWIEHENGFAVEEDLAKGGDYIMLLLLPKNFSSEFRENWEGYRTEYWDRENERRAALRKKVRLQRRTKAKEQGGWRWWTGTWRLNTASQIPRRRPQDLEKHLLGSHSQASKDSSKPHRRRSVLRDGSHSRQSSRSTTPHSSHSHSHSHGTHVSHTGGIELDGSTDSSIKPLGERVRRGSSVSSTSSLRRSTKSGGGHSRRADGMLSPLTAVDLDKDEDSAAAAAAARERERRARRKEREREREREKEKEREKDFDGAGGEGEGGGDSRRASRDSEVGIRHSTPSQGLGVDKENALPKEFTPPPA